jgi:hypothetical protein
VALIAREAKWDEGSKKLRNGRGGMSQFFFFIFTIQILQQKKYLENRSSKIMKRFQF